MSVTCAEVGMAVSKPQAVTRVSARRLDHRLKLPVHNGREGPLALEDSKLASV